MSTMSVQEQIEVIQKASKEINTKEKAMAFLISAGIIEPAKEEKKKSKA
jgi:hypothetical protein